MGDLGVLPESLTVNGHEYAIETDYRSYLTVIQAMNDPDLESATKVQVCLTLYKGFGPTDDANQVEPEETLRPEDYEEAYKAACKFLDHGSHREKAPPIKLMDWEQDEDILFPAVNRAAGFEVRAVEYMHWWTFLGLLMSVDSESVWAHVMALRSKRAKGKKLEKWEAEYWNANRELCELRRRLTPEEKQAERQRREELKKLFV